MLTFEFFVQEGPLNLKEHLLQNFTPDNACPMGQVSTEATGSIYQSALKDEKASDLVTCTAFIFSSKKKINTI